MNAETQGSFKEIWNQDAAVAEILKHTCILTST